MGCVPPSLRDGRRLVAMAKNYQVTGMIRTVNWVMAWLARRGRGPAHVLTTTGRSSGDPRSVPVSPIARDGVEYLVSPYGEVAWVKNVRANPVVTLEREKTIRTCRLVEVTGQAPEVVKAYYEREGFARKYMDVPDDPSLADFEAASAAFPVFRVETT